MKIYVHSLLTISFVYSVDAVSFNEVYMVTSAHLERDKPQEVERVKWSFIHL